MKLIRARMSLPRPTTVISILALCLAVGGTAVAANRIGSGDVRNNSLTGKDIRNKSLTKKDFKGSIRGPRGPRGLTGATGPAGQAGVSGATNVVVRLGTPASYNAGNPGVFTATCDPGERAVGGGVNVSGEADSNPSGVTQVIESYPTTTGNASTAGSTPNGWRTAVTREIAGDDTATAYVVCVSP